MKNFLLIIISFPLFVNAQIISTITTHGTGVGDINGVVFDSHGNLYFTDVLGNKVKKMDSSYSISVVAGTGSTGFYGDGGPATNAKFNQPVGITLDSLGNIFVADANNSRVRKIDISTGIITTIAGDSTYGFSGDGGPATAASLYDPNGICFDKLGNLYITDARNYRVRKINTSGIISSIAGTGIIGSVGDGGPATAARCSPGDINADSSGNLYFTQNTYRTIRKIDTSGIISTIAGDTSSHIYNGDGFPATNAHLAPTWLAVGKDGLLYISDAATNARIRVIDSSGYIHTIAGDGTLGHSGDGGSATAAAIENTGIAFDHCGNLFFGEVYVTEDIRKVTFNPFLTAISGSSSVCQGSSITLTDSITGGTWSASNSNVSVTDSGVVTGIAAGTATISYSVSNSCGTVAAIKVVTISPLPNVGMISGEPSVCTGTVVTLTDTATGGAWSVSNGNASVASGMVTGIAAGIDTISYSATNACGTNVATFAVTVNTLPGAGTITGAGSVCVSTNDTLADSILGGTWICSNASASVTAGIVTGLSTGIDTVSYSVVNSCGATTSVKIITINPLPPPDSIMGLSAVCTGLSITLSNTITGGTWSATNADAAVSSPGLVIGLSAGTDSIYYTLSNSCGTSSVFKIITINTMPVAGTITGPDRVCVGLTDTLYDSIAAGTWISSNSHAGIAGSSSVTPSIIAGISVGIDTIVYSVTNSCGTSVATKIITINPPLPYPGTITGPTLFCLGATDTLRDSVSGGTWISSAAGTVIIDSSGIIHSVSVGIVPISYAFTNACGTAVATINVTSATIPFSGIITGADSVCAGSTLTLTDTASLGTIAWHSSDSLIATVAGGIVSGVAAGRDTIYYTVTNSCGTSTARKPITIKTTPSAGTITGADSVCIGASITPSDSVTGGLWSCSNTNATNAGNVITGVSVGLDTIAYSLSNYCGTTTITKIIAVHTIPDAPGAITGPDSVCPGSVITLSDTTLWGIWSCTDTTNATISTTGVVTGINYGIDTAIYMLSNSCGTSSTLHPVNILSLPDAGFISGPDSVCIGTSIVQLSTVPGGIWSCSSANATISGDTVTGAIAGLDTIRYSLTNSCATATALHTIRILQRPYPGDILGLDSVCVGARVVLYDTVPGGIMSCTNNASLDTGNQLTGLIPGLDTVFYAVTNYCGTSRASKIVTINPLPDAGIITGIDSVCLHSRIILNDSIPAGAWSALNGNAMFIGDTLQGVTVGNDSIYYTVTNICGTAIARYWVRILSLPNAGSIISSSSNYCVGDSVTMRDTGAIGAGLWLATNTNARLVPPAVGVTNDMVVSVSVGSDTIIYVATNSCGTDTTKQPIAIIDKPAKPTVSGGTIVCIGSRMSDTLLGSPPGGIWAVTNSLVTDSAGIITAISQGMDTVVYSVSNHCGTNVDSLVLTIPPRRACDTEGVAKIALPQNTIYIYPNPAHNELTITSGYSLTSITITNLLGQKLLQAISIYNSEMQLNIGNFPKGVYLIEITNSEGKKIMNKFIKE